MDIAGGEKAMRLREVRIILDRQEQLWQGLVEAPTKKQRHADRTENLAEPAARAEAQRNLKARDSQSGLARHIPENAADIPAAGKARVERQRTVDQRDHGTHILAEIGERESGIGERAGIVTGHLEGAPGEIGTLAAVHLGICAQPVQAEPLTAD